MFDYAAYVIYGVSVDKDHMDRCDSCAGVRPWHRFELRRQSLQAGQEADCPNVEYRIAGPRHEWSFFLVTFCEVAVLGEEISFQVDQGYSSLREQEASWDRELARAASVLGLSEHVRAEPSWRVILDER